MASWQLENRRFCVEINAEGGELVRLWDRQRNADLLWQATAGIWNNSATQLFPVVGRLIHKGLWDDGDFYALPDHGFLRHQTFACLEQGPDSLLLEAKATSQTLDIWPWQWRVHTMFTLDAEGISVSQRVFNDDARPFWFSLGWHPGFTLPITEPGWQVEFSSRPVQGPFYTRDRTLAVPEHPSEINAFALTETCFKAGAVYFANCQDQRIIVRSPNGQMALSLQIKQQPWLALWSVPGSDLLCLEPLAGTTDAPDFSGQITQKRGMQRLDPGKCQRFDTRIGFAVDE